MAKRSKNKNVPLTPEEEAREFFAALEELERQRGISRDYMLERITQAMIAVYKRDHERVGDNIAVIADQEKNQVRMILRREVVEEVDNPDTEISLEEARKSLPQVQVGDVVSSDLKVKSFSRIAAQTARQVIVQGIREAERTRVYDQFKDHAQELMSGTVSRIDPRNGTLHIKLMSGGEVADGLMPTADQVPGETYREGDLVQVYISEVRQGTRGTQIMVSRTNYGLVRRLFELEVPELFDGTVEIKSLAREAGSRTKMAVWSSDPNIDPIGACVGTRGARVNTVVQALHGEKVDIMRYSEDPAIFIAAALAPADVVRVDTLPGDQKACRAVVPDDQLSLAIGKEGQNARLAARLTGYKIDIKSVTADAADPLLPYSEDDLLADEDSAEEILDEGAAPEEQLEETSPAETAEDDGLLAD